MPWHHYSHDVLPLLAVVSPIIGLITTLAVSRSNVALARPMALSNSAMTMLIVAAVVWLPDSTERLGIHSARSGVSGPRTIWLGINTGQSDPQAMPIVKGLNIRVCFANDGLSAWPALLLSVTVWGVICAVGRHEGLSYSSQCMCLMATQSLLLGSFFATDAIVAIVFLETALLPIYLLLGTCGDDMRRPASSTWWLWQVAGCSCSLVGITLLAVSQPWMGSDLASRAGLNFNGRLITDGVRQLLAQSEAAWHLWGQLAPWAAGLLLLGLLIRLPVYPFQGLYHSSLAAAPCGIAALIAVAFPLAALNTWLQFGLPLFGLNNVGLATLLGAFSLVGALQASFSLQSQTDLKLIFARLSSIMLCIAGIGLSTQSQDGVRGAWLLVISQAITVASGMFIVQMLEARFGTRDLKLLSRQIKAAPRVTALLTLVLFTCTGVPVILAFSAVYLQLSAMSGNLWLIGGASVALAMLAWATLIILSQIMAATSASPATVLHDARPSMRRQPDIARAEAWALLPLMVVAALVTVAPTALTNRCEPTFQRLFGRANAHTAVSTFSPTTR